ncbi:MAG: DUF4153 domain-containing protein [Sphingobacteriia bacterium]|nr:DUF4153 domain-containing protein [Sphingobacteriia bacterium]
MFKNKIRENTLNVFKSVILLITFVIIINIICSHLLKFSLLSHATLLKFTCFCQFGLFNILWLAGVPNKFDEEPNKEDYKLYSTLFASNLYIIIPAILVLLFLLNIYLLKILFIKTITNSTSDNYWISIYTILTGLIGMQVFNSYEILQKNVSRYIKTFKFLFPIFYILPLGYCIYKIGNEFNTQGITFFEYIKALILISLIYPIVLLLIQKEKDTYKKYMLFFSIILLLGSFGPWGVNKLPVYSKFTALETILVKNRILENGVINKDYKNEITLPDKALVREKLRYLIQFDSIELIKPWFKNMPESVINQYKTSEVLSLNKNLFEVLFVGNENLIENILKDIGISEPTQNKNNKSQSSSGGYAGILPEDYTVYITGEGNIMNIYPVPNSKKVIFPTKNHYQGIDGCYMECYSNKKQNAVYSVAKDLYVIGQVRIKGKYNQFLVCNPNGNIKESFKLCEKYFPESCKNNYCKP